MNKFEVAITINKDGNKSLIPMDKDQGINVSIMVKDFQSMNPDSKWVGQESKDIIRNFLNRRETLEDIILYERELNPEYKSGNFTAFINNRDRKRLDPKSLIKEFNLTIIKSKSGKKGGIWFYSEDLIIDLGSYLSREFKLAVRKAYRDGVIRQPIRIDLAEHNKKLAIAIKSYVEPYMGDSAYWKFHQMINRIVAPELASYNRRLVANKEGLALGLDFQSQLNGKEMEFKKKLIDFTCYWLKVNQPFFEGGNHYIGKNKYYDLERQLRVFMVG